MQRAGTLSRVAGAPPAGVPALRRAPTSRALSAPPARRTAVGFSNSQTRLAPRAPRPRLCAAAAPPAAARQAASPPTGSRGDGNEATPLGHEESTPAENSAGARLVRATRELAALAGDAASALPDELAGLLGAMEAEVAEGARRTAAAEAEAVAARDRHLRLAADYDNFRRRSASEREAASSEAAAGALERLLPLLDSFDGAQRLLGRNVDGEESGAGDEGEGRRGAGGAPPAHEAADPAALLDALRSISKQASELFRAAGLERVEARGAAFDPASHEAVLREPRDDVPEGTVLEEFRAGYRMGGKLLRPAMVKVSHGD